MRYVVLAAVAAFTVSLWVRGWRSQSNHDGGWRE